MSQHVIYVVICGMLPPISCLFDLLNTLITINKFVSHILHFIEYVLIMLRIKDSSIKSGCCILTIFQDGYSFLFRHPPGFLYSPLPHTSSKDLIFMENTNSSGSRAGLIAALLSNCPQDYQEGTFLPHIIVLVDGIFSSNDGYCLVYYPMKQGITNIYSLFQAKLTNDNLINAMFESNPQTCILSTKYVMYFNQIIGPTHSSFQCNFQLCTHKSGLSIYQSGKQSDVWGVNRTRSQIFQQKLLRFRLTITYKPNNYIPSYRCKDAIFTGAHRLCQSKDQTVIALYCLHNPSSRYSGLFFQPIPTPRSSNYQDFALLTAKQAKSLDGLCKKSFLSIEKFMKCVIDFSTTNETKFIRIRRMSPMISGKKYKYIVSVVSSPLNAQTESYLNEFGHSISGETTIWSSTLPKNQYDFDTLHGFPIGHFFPSTLEKFINQQMMSLVSSYLTGRGLSRCISPHFGSFFIVGTRHSRMSSRTMNQYNQNEHEYSNRAYTNTSIGPWVKSLLNHLQRYAGEMQSHCGTVMDSLSDTFAKERNCHGWGIVTSNFSNTFHVDNDWDSRHTNAILNHIQSSASQKLKQHVENYQLVFSEPFLKGKLPLSTSCCWVYPKLSLSWLHIQYFVLAEVDLAFDLSSDLFVNGIDQLSSVFYGGLFGHLTSRSLWVNNENNLVSTIDPLDGFHLFAWGRYRSRSRGQV